jgi:hypothetical protein
MMAGASVTMTVRKRSAEKNTAEEGSDTKKSKLRRLKSELNNLLYVDRM